MKYKLLSGEKISVLKLISFSRILTEALSSLITILAGVIFSSVILLYELQHD